MRCRRHARISGFRSSSAAGRQADPSEARRRRPEAAAIAPADPELGTPLFLQDAPKLRAEHALGPRPADAEAEEGAPGTVFAEIVGVARVALLGELNLSGAAVGQPGSVANLAKGRCVTRGDPAHLMILHWPDSPVATPWPRSGRTVRDRRRARRYKPRRQCRPGGRKSRLGLCAARASPRNP